MGYNIAMSSMTIAPPTTPPVWIEHPNLFTKVVADLCRHPVVAVDTESNSLFAYREQVCLIQFSTGENDFLVDPLSLADLSALEPLFADPTIEKVFHAAEYDVICLKRDFGFHFANLFDTMVASRILGRTAVGLAGVIEKEFGVALDKRYQRANWGARPLAAAMLAYARLDTYYLIDLRQRLKAALEQMNRLALAEEDFRRLCDISAGPSDPDPSTWLRVAAGQDLTAQQAAILDELCRYRDQRARSVDLPVFKILSNQMLVSIATSCPRTLQDLVHVTGLNGRQLERHADGLLSAVQRGLQAPPLHRTAMPRPDERFLNRLDRLKSWRKHTGEDWGVESDVILPRDVMEALAHAGPRRPEELAELMASVPWRLQKFGDQILSLINR